MDNELETWTEKTMNEQKYRSGIFSDKKSLFARAMNRYFYRNTQAQMSNFLSVFTSKKSRPCDFNKR
jgi:hypothetical protein